MSSSKPGFILLPFFNRLRESAGMELDMNQYFLFLELFMQGHAKDEPALLNLCKTLWLTKLEYKDIFEHWFKEAVKDLREQWLPSAGIESDPEIEANINKADQKGKQEETDAAAERKEEQKAQGPNRDNEPSNEPITGGEKSEPSLNLTDVLLNFEEGKGKAATAGKKTPKEVSEKNSTFIFSDDKHLPIAPRRMGHLLQKLLMNQSYRPGNQLDVAAMVETFGKFRYVDTLYYKLQRVSEQKVILLSDHQGSMAAFESWGDYLFRIFTDHPAIKSVERYYFHDFPSAVEDEAGFKSLKFYTNPEHTSAHTLEKILGNQAVPIWLVIFSDAGAYQTTLDHESLQQWMDFFDAIAKRGVTISWFNPLPKRRWAGSLANYLSLMVKMEAFNPEGTRSAIKWANHANRNRKS
ncbi:MAG: hypothetical protein SFV55_16690 [Haliscomenobacter sp.]|uniref:hypothetical protein n=1 Tax=Haliscomenobacter sp. TaxID=2717303 RepID=UPI0029A305B3|nr:hypothetical protein [Haliscomenobacter sp.]MDX2070067.1 hypothetical protein [Haliscomenobacter sp.]